jgi:Transmembrane proteins 230/134
MMEGIGPGESDGQINFLWFFISLMLSESIIDTSAPEMMNRFSQRAFKRIKTLLAAIILFVIGSVLLYFGVKDFNTDRERSLPLIILGSITFIPGSYATTIFIGSFLGWRGYNFETLPSYDDED